MNTAAPGCAAGDAMHLLAELDALGVQFEALPPPPDTSGGGAGGRLRYRPREAVTMALAARMQACKAELLAAVRKREELDRRFAEQLAQLVPYQTADGRRVRVHPRYRRELESFGLL